MLIVWFCFKAISAPYERVFPAEKDCDKDVEDNCECSTVSISLSRLCCLNSGLFEIIMIAPAGGGKNYRQSGGNILNFKVLKPSSNEEPTAVKFIARRKPQILAKEEILMSLQRCSTTL